KHRTDNFRRADVLTNAVDQLKLAKFLESIDLHTVPFVALTLFKFDGFVILVFDTVAGVQYGIEERSVLTGPADLLTTVTGPGEQLGLLLPIENTPRFFRLVGL